MHFLPQTYFLGDNPDYFTKISIMPSIDGITDEICNFFEKKISLKQIQTNHGLNPISKEKLEDYIDDLKMIYKDDYKFIGSINSNLI